MHNVVVIRSPQSSALYLKGKLCYTTQYESYPEISMLTLSHFISEMPHVTFKYLEVAHTYFYNDWPEFQRLVIYDTKI